MKALLSDRAPKTVNNILTVLNTLKNAIEWGELTQMPCTIRLLKGLQIRVCGGVRG